MSDLVKDVPHQAELIAPRELKLEPAYRLALSSKPDVPRLAILVNGSAGGYRLFGSARLKAALRAAGLEREVPLILCSGDELHSKALSLARDGVPAVGVFGGDGSARTVALALRGLDVPMLPLPGGTLNRLCQRVHGHADLGRTLRDFTQAKPIWLSGGLANDHAFLVASGFGPWMAFHQVRETVRIKGLLAGLQILKILRRDLFAAKMRMSRSSLRCDLVIAAPTFVDQAFGLSQSKEALDDGKLEVAGARFSGVGTVCTLVASVLCRSWRHRSFVRALPTQVQDLEADGEDIVGLVDGEMRSFGCHVHLKAFARAALVLSTNPDRKCY